VCAARSGEVAVREQRQTTAALIRQQHLKPVVFEYGNHCSADPWFVVVGCAPMEIDDLPFCGNRLSSAPTPEPGSKR
jgi:hypothetical protein